MTDKEVEVFIVDPLNNYWMTMTTAIMAATSSNPVNYQNGDVDLTGQNGLLKVYSFKNLNNAKCTDVKCNDWAPKRVILMNTNKEKFQLCGFSLMGTFTCPPTAA